MPAGTYQPKFNSIAETVKCDFDMNLPFDVSLIEKLKVYNLSKQEWDVCEVWGSDSSDYGIIADFDFNITPTELSLYFAESLYYGYYESQYEIVILPRGTLKPYNFNTIGYFKLDQRYSVPKTLADLANNIFHFQNMRISEIIILQGKNPQLQPATTNYNHF